jgi:predicted metal-dependent phosphoesterase TrpH
MFVDLHIHTYYSDGVFSPKDIVKKCSQYGFKYISITDHDSIDGALEIHNNSPIKLISGVELSCKSFNFGIPQVKGSALHLLGYGFDLSNNVLKDALDNYNRKRIQIIVDFLMELKKYNVQLTPSDIPIKHGRLIQFSALEELVDKIVMKPQCSSLIQEYKELLDAIKFHPLEAISLIHEAGGVAIWAHPFITYLDEQPYLLDRMLIEQILEFLINNGLDGIEANYLSFSPQQRNYLNTLANENNLLTSIGSDYHGYAGRDSFIKEDVGGVMPLLQRIG